MKKAILPVLPFVLVSPLLLLVLGIGHINLEQARAACATPGTTIETATARGSFRVGTLNWRGASHYATNPHPGERPYLERVPHMVAKIGASATSIIGFQEFEPPQAEAFLDATDGAWDLVPGRRRGKASTADALAYQPRAWRVDEVRYVSIRYGGPTIQVPLARFTPTSTSGLTSTAGADAGSVWVLNTHHPADAVGGSDAMRDAAVSAEAQALRELQEAEPSTPLLLTGDMNDRARFRQVFLSIADGWTAANPGDEQIDWIMGSPAVTFSGTVVDQSTNDHARRHTDHPFVHTTVHLRAPSPELSEPAPVAEVSGKEVADLPEVPSTPASTSRPSGCPPCPTPMTDPAIQPPAGTGAGTLAADLAAAHVAADAARRAGFRGDDLVTAVAIAGVESAWNPHARNGTHFGLWQIAGTHRGKVPGWNQPADIYDPILNARYAFALYSARPGAGEAKFADWVPFHESDYRRYLDIAREAAATTSDADATTVTVADCTEVAAELSAALRVRIDAMMRTPHGLCALSWTSGAPCTYQNQCPKVVDALYGGSGVGRGYGNGEDVARGIIDAGLAQSHGTGLDPLPPVGAVVSYNSGNDVGHVAIHVGVGRIFGNDYGCTANGVFGCVGFTDIHTPPGSVTWALPDAAFDLGGMPTA